MVHFVMLGGVVFPQRVCVGLLCFVLPVLLSACLQKRHTWVMLKEIMQTAVLSLPHWCNRSVRACVCVYCVAALVLAPLISHPACNILATL